MSKGTDEVKEEVEEAEEKLKPPRAAWKKRVAGEVKRLFSLRQRLRKGRPRFLRQESWRYKRVGEGWRRPRGRDSKMRQKIRGYPKLVNVGYGSPKGIRGLHPSGFKEVLVYNPRDLEKIDPGREAARIAHTVGARKRFEILEKARDLKIVVLNPREVEEIESE